MPGDGKNVEFITFLAHGSFRRKKKYHCLKKLIEKMAGGDIFRYVFTKLPLTYDTAMEEFLLFLQRMNINSKTGLSCISGRLCNYGF